MKLPQKNKKKLTIVIIAVILVIAGGLAAGAYFYKVGPFEKSDTTVNMQPATEQQQETGDQIKQANSDAETNDKPSGSDQPEAPVLQPSGKSAITVSITASNQNGNILQIRSLIEAVSSNGTCTLTFTRSGYKSVVKTSGVQALASTSTCQGFDVPVSELAKGSWNVSLVFESATLKGEATEMVTVQ